MDETLNRGYPYPQCDPPLTKDASDIAHVRDLAAAIDADVQTVYDNAADIVVRPDAARMGIAPSVADTFGPGDFSPTFNTRTFDTTGTSMTPTAEGVLRLVEPGWYTVGGYGEFTTATFLGLRMCFLQNGVQATSYTQQARVVAGNVQLAFNTGELFVPTGGDALTMRFRIGAASPSFTYIARIWAQQIAKL